ncbi:RecX family transcriptional regulator [Ruminococcaceae bacterium OttesenSCG-928-I18]|nr:RecX family transcriptional regulator [Ruminococcaceae bacterium OttesenSCG-928-I18]
MRKITAIQKTKQGRFSLFTEEGFLFSVDGETLHKHGILEGSSFSEEELSCLKEDSDTRKAKDKAMRLLARRAHGTRELREKLCLHFDADTADAAVAALLQLGLLDDEAFAQQRADALAEKGKSRQEIEWKLIAQGIDREVAKEAAASVEGDEAELALRLVRGRYWEQMQKGKRQTVMAALARRGFSHADIQYAVDAAETSQGEE